MDTNLEVCAVECMLIESLLLGSIDRDISFERKEISGDTSKETTYTKSVRALCGCNGL